MQPCSSTNEVRGCSVPAYSWYQSWVNIILRISLINKLTVIAPPSMVLLVHVRMVLPLFVCPRACTIQLLRLHRVPQPRRKPSWEKINLAGVPDNRCNSSARVRMECVIVPSWPLPSTSFEVNITTLANSDFPLPSGGNCC